VTYTAEQGAISAIYRPFDDSPAIVRRTSVVRFTAPGSITNGDFGLWRFEMQPKAGGPDPHFHRTFSESFYVLEGTVSLYNGEAWVDATAGDFLYVPKGGIHAFANSRDMPAAMLILFAPGFARERFVEAMNEFANAGRELGPEEWTAFYREYDQYMV
jgi:mannose-6-phosphate isomerase-like protein (cupin superfamily)